MTNWQEVKLGDICKFISTKIDMSNISKYNYISTENMLPNKAGIVNATNLPNTTQVSSFSLNDTLVSNIRPYFKKIWCASFCGGCSNDVLVFRANKGVDTKFLYYLLCNDEFFSYATSTSKGTKMPRGDKVAIMKYPVLLPPLATQKQIAGVLSALDDKIELNNKINNNLEQQAQALFDEMFFEDIVSVYSKNHLPLSELVQNIDNRGKTPLLSLEKTDFPIIDVRALSGNTRIINYDNCTKFVSQETYLTGFRSGLPQKYDILLSTVGSLGEIKLFIESKGCIAQNVIGYRSKISPFYLYQYLKTIKNDLLAYDIGSVQPSIKVTHIAKHPIFIPSDDKLKEFQGFSEVITNKIYVNSLENTQLAQLRETLLPKLMSGEIDVSQVDIPSLSRHCKEDNAQRSNLPRHCEE